jgi:hypothetical protein
VNRDLALIEDDVSLRIDAGGEEGSRHLADVARQLDRILPDRDRMHVDDAIDAVMRLLQRDEIDDGA